MLEGVSLLLRYVVKRTGVGYRQQAPCPRWTCIHVGFKNRLLHCDRCFNWISTRSEY